MTNILNSMESLTLVSLSDWQRALSRFSPFATLESLRMEIKLVTEVCIVPGEEAECFLTEQL